LNAIIGYSEMLQEEAEDRAQAAVFVPDLQKIHTAGKHLLAIINDVLDLSKIEAGKMELYLESFDLRALVKDVQSTITPLVEKNQNVIEVKCPEDVGTMYADVTRVRQVLFNLLSNAAKFTERGLINLEVETGSVADEDSVFFIGDRIDDPDSARSSRPLPRPMLRYPGIGGRVISSSANASDDGRRDRGRASWAADRPTPSVARTGDRDSRRATLCPPPQLCSPRPSTPARG
jgi:hypothetical protein